MTVDANLTSSAPLAAQLRRMNMLQYHARDVDYASLVCTTLEALLLLYASSMLPMWDHAVLSVGLIGRSSRAVNDVSRVRLFDNTIRLFHHE